MARYRDDRYAHPDMAYRDAPTQRWDRDRFAREGDHRGSYVAEREVRGPRRTEVDYARYQEDDRYGPQGYRSDRRYHEEDDYHYNDPRASRGAMIPFRPEPVPRPRMVRRQSSLDTFDRLPPRRYNDFEEYERRAPPPQIPVPVPRRRSPRRYSRREDGYADYRDIRIQDPDRYGDEGFREFREREWVRHRRRSRSRSSSSSSSSSSSASVSVATKTTKAGGTVIEKREEIREETVVKSGEKTYPRRGKTRMPKRLVHTKVLHDLGYHFYEEDERTLVVELALGPDNIDQIVTMSREYKETETTHLIEAPPARETVIAETRAETVAFEAAPRSVREWDGLRSNEGRSVVSRATALSPRAHSPARSRAGTVIREVTEKEIIRERSPARPSFAGTRSRRGSGTIVAEHVEKEIIRESSPARTAMSRRSRRSRRPSSGGVSRTVIEKETIRRSRSRSRSSSSSSSSRSRTVIEKTKVVHEHGLGTRDESAPVGVGPLALVVDRTPSRSDRELREDIRRLERERRDLRRERRSFVERDDYVGGSEVVKIERYRSPSPSPIGEVIVERRGSEVVEVRKDRRARSRPPPPGIIKAMMATLT